MDRDSIFMNAYAAPTMKFDDNYKCLMTDNVFNEISKQIL